MVINTTSLEGVFLVNTTFFQDERGGFSRFFCSQELKEILGEREIVQINFSTNINKGTIRGMHFQKKPHSEMKLIRCIRGRVLDVAIDLRRGSETFLSYFSTELSEKNKDLIIIPEGFAHGFQVLEENSQLLYMHTEYYSPESEGGINPLDPNSKIDWPLPVNKISEKDKSRPFIDKNFEGLEI